MGRAVERAQSLGEEIANSVSHGLGLLAALAARPLADRRCGSVRQGFPAVHP